MKIIYPLLIKDFNWYFLIYLFSFEAATDYLLNLGENISESASALDSTSESNSGTASKPQQQPNVLEAEKDDPNNPR